jgi:BirA family biotin operon repressor/biotin-[acetyl-CoA-carboxylase] ligase
MKYLSPTLKRLIEILNDGQLHSGQDLSLALGISRNAVWKHIQQVLSYGIEIKTIQSTGYRLTRPLFLLDETEIRKVLGPANVSLEILGSVSSTNDFPKEAPSTGALQFRLAEHQTAGRGRFRRPWVAPFGANILMSCRWRCPQDLSACGGLSLCVGLSVAQALGEFGLEDIRCKWPNDILYRQQKLAGVLIELQAEAHGQTEAIIGIGCNVNMPAEFLSALERPATSLEVILGQAQDRNRMAALLIRSLQTYLHRFTEKGFADFLPEWHSLDALRDKNIRLELPQASIEGTVLGINELGHLLVKDSSGETKAYSAGEASLSSAIKGW